MMQMGISVDAINAVSDDTGVVAGLSSTGALTLTAADGRNIAVEFSGAAVADAVGFDGFTAAATIVASTVLQ